MNSVGCSKVGRSFQIALWGSGAVWAAGLLLANALLNSSFAQGVIVPVPLQTKLAKGTNGIELAWDTVPGKIYHVLSTEQVTGPWEPARDAGVTATSTHAELQDAAGGSAGFFQVFEQEPIPPNSEPITSAVVAESEKLSGLTFTEEERVQMLPVLHDLRVGFLRLRNYRLLNSDALPFFFDPRPDDFVFSSVEDSFQWTPPQDVGLPASDAELVFYSVGQLAELIRTRQITSSELTRLYLDRLKRYDPVLHCVVTLTEELALEQAARADGEIASGRYRGPLHGIPYGLKDLFSTRRYRTTWGAYPYRDQLIDEDAAVVRRLEEAGAVLIAKLSLGALANHDVWFGGQTRNPWNPEQGSGGSSAGSAAAAAAGLVGFAIGTETLASIINPASICRVSGLRSTFGRVSRSGAMVVAWTIDKVGVIGRSADDCALVLDAIRGTDPEDRATVDAPFAYDPNMDLTGLKIGYREGFVSQEFLDALQVLVDPTGIRPVTFPDYPLTSMVNIILQSEAAAAFDELTRFNGDDFLVSQGERDWPNLLRSGRTIPAAEYLQANRLRKQLIEDFSAAMNETDLLVTTSRDADALLLGNLAGLPAVVVPIGGDLGLTLVGKPFDEAVLLALARAFQELTGLHTARPPLFVE